MKCSLTFQIPDLSKHHRGLRLKYYIKETFMTIHKELLIIITIILQLFWFNLIENMTNRNKSLHLTKNNVNDWVICVL